MNSYDIEKVMRSEGAHSLEGTRQGKFWDMAPFEGGTTWIGKWRGESPWERHSYGDEFLHVLFGQVEVVLITKNGKKSVVVPMGNIFVVPKNHWHKQIAQSEVVVLGATPGITDETDVEPVF